ncbi:SWIM zinc finger family protein [Inquilinus limosus]|uniref:SWIM-type domain-containing protein n=1 Tax=Inquilinus limosus TaxID=171674 RepID=A0A211ZP68_9PROT|nr:DUF6880 family protein [Inquilinus limosus]OWJ67065.1 hypothetical protein BWR60_11030 [Inquilinus limosus]
MAKTSTRKAAQRFDIDAIRRLSGETTFARGSAYHAAGRVAILSSHAGRITAKVFGSETYDASLAQGVDHPAGDCSCPAFAGIGWCKHLVAVALAANDLADGETSGSRPDPVRDHLRSLSAETLVEMVLEQAGKDPGLRRRLELAAAMTQGDDAMIHAHLKKAITAATRTDGIEYRRVRSWVRGIGDFLDRIEDLLDGGRAQLGLDLLEHVLDRMAPALAEIDDSDGDGMALFGRAEKLHLQACQTVRPDPVALARRLFRRETESLTDAFSGSTGTYGDVLGREGLAEYRRLAEAAWAQLPSRRADDRRASQDHEYASKRHALFSILDDLAETDGDFDRRVALLTKDLSSVSGYEKLVDLCLAHGRPEAAVKWAEEGLWLFQGVSAELLSRKAVSLYRRSGRTAEAEALLWRCFDRRPSSHLLNELKVLAGGDAGGAVLDRAVAVMRQRLAGRQKTGQWWGGFSDADFLVEILLAQGRLAEAWAVTDAHDCQARTVLAVAAASETTEPAKVVALYEQLVERHVGHTTQAGYEEACRLIDTIGRIRKDRTETAIHAAYVAELKTRHKAKRNFMKLLASRA